MKLPFQIDLAGKVVVVTGACGGNGNDRRKGSAARLK